jgi:hypothetical protein
LTRGIGMVNGSIAISVHPVEEKHDKEGISKYLPPRPTAMLKVTNTGGIDLHIFKGALAKSNQFMKAGKKSLSSLIGFHEPMKHLSTTIVVNGIVTKMIQSDVR